MIITIDGPAGSGKSTAARELAKVLNISFLDTGATYRAATLKALRENVDLEDETALAKVVGASDIQIIPEKKGVRVILDGQDVSKDIRTEEVTNNSHLIARSVAVRKVLVDLQRKIGAQLGDFVSEGRDQGSVVFPDAEIKFYLDASNEVRARRRYEEMATAGYDVELEKISNDIADRDHKDKNRPVAPLVKPEGAIVIDTSEMTIEQVVVELKKNVEAKL